MKKRFGFFVFSAIAFVLSWVSCLASPFGLNRGMSKSTVIALVGAPAILRSEGDILTLKTVPQPHAAFDEYLLVFSPSEGLLKVVAVGKDIRTSGDGSEVRSAYSELKDALETGYGNPKDSFDFLKSGSIWKDSSDFMMGLLKDERLLVTYWNFEKGARSDRLSTIKIEAKATRSSIGFITVGYEFEGLEAYIDSKNAKQNSVL